MKSKSMTLGFCVILVTAMAGCVESRHRWAVHDMSRPLPKVVTPGTASTEQQPGRPPSDAIVLFDGKDLSKWVSDKDGGPAKWKVENGYMEVTRKTGHIRTKQAFGDCQLHVEWACSTEIDDSGQSRGNSGVFLMGKYEVQVLDSYNNTTYADGQAASIYGQEPPMVNACLPPGRWQSYDIIFRRPRFDKNGKVVCPSRITVLQNGVLVQENFELEGPTRHKKRTRYKPHGDKLPIRIQDHGEPVRYRNIWIRKLPEL